MLADRRVIEALDDFVEKARDEEALGDFCRNTAGAQIEKFVLVDLTGRRAVSATDVIGQNFETRHRVRFGVVAKKKVANFLIRVGKMSVRFHADESAENRASVIVKRV